MFESQVFILFAINNFLA